jgi:hypothetical protein
MAPPSTGIIAHRAGDAGRDGGEHERGRPAELLGLAVPAQRDVLRQAGTYLIGIAAKGIKFTDPSAAILTGSSPLTGAWPGRVRWRVSSPPWAGPGNSLLEMASSVSGPCTEGASMKTVEAAAPAREPGTCRGGSGCASECPPLRVLLPIVAVTGRAP